MCKETQLISLQDCRLLLMRINRKQRESLNLNNKSLICKDNSSKHKIKLNNPTKEKHSSKVNLLTLKNDSMNSALKSLRSKLLMLKRKNRKWKKFPLELYLPSEEQKNSLWERRLLWMHPFRSLRNQWEALLKYSMINSEIRLISINWIRLMNWKINSEKVFLNSRTSLLNKLLLSSLDSKKSSSLQKKSSWAPMLALRIPILLRIKSKKDLLLVNWIRTLTCSRPDWTEPRMLLISNRSRLLMKLKKEKQAEWLMIWFKEHWLIPMMLTIDN